MLCLMAACLSAPSLTMSPKISSANFGGELQGVLVGTTVWPILLVTDVCADDLEEFSIVEDGGNDGIEVVIEPVVDGIFSSALTPATQVLTWPPRESFLLTLVFNTWSKKCRLGEEEHDQ